jgi:hypothetical protein
VKIACARPLLDGEQREDHLLSLRGPAACPLGGQRWIAPDQDGLVMRDLVTNHRLSDGRIQRGERTRQALIKAYLDLLREKQKPPAAPVIARRAGCSIRSVFHNFSDLLTLSLAAADYAFAQAAA